jgi:hypothetical protein
MKYLIILSLFFISSCNTRIHRDYKKMQRKVERRERIKNREIPSGIDTVYYRWTPINDTVLLGTPRIPR